LFSACFSYFGGEEGGESAFRMHDRAY
jgi:hypothetical protein